MGKQLRNTHYNRFSEKRAGFRPTDIEHVADARYVFQRNVGAVRSQSVDQPCPVHKKRHPEPAAFTAQRLKLVQPIKRADLGGMGNVDHTGKHAMFISRIGIKPLHAIFQGRSPNLTVAGRKRKHLVP